MEELKLSSKNLEKLTQLKESLLEIFSKNILNKKIPLMEMGGCYGNCKGGCEGRCGGCTSCSGWCSGPI